MLNRLVLVLVGPKRGRRPGTGKVIETSVNFFFSNGSALPRLSIGRPLPRYNIYPRTAKCRDAFAAKYRFHSHDFLREVF